MILDNDIVDHRCGTPSPVVFTGDNYEEVCCEEVHSSVYTIGSAHKFFHQNVMQGNSDTTLVSFAVANSKSVCVRMESIVAMNVLETPSTTNLWTDLTMQKSYFCIPRCIFDALIRSLSDAGTNLLLDNRYAAYTLFDTGGTPYDFVMIRDPMSLMDAVPVDEGVNPGCYSILKDGRGKPMAVATALTTLSISLRKKRSSGCASELRCIDFYIYSAELL